MHVEASKSTTQWFARGYLAIAQVVLLSLLSACGSPPASSLQQPPAEGGFSLSIAPSSLVMPPGATVTAMVSVARTATFMGAIEISLDGVPEGVRVDPLTIPAGASTGTLTLHNARNGNPVVDAAISVRGRSGSHAATATFALSVQCPASAQQLRVLAGAPGGPGYADDTGENARFNQPNAVVGDGAGHLYVADLFNQVIRKIDLASGAVTTIAGSPGNLGSSDGTGDAARFSFPSALAIAGGSLFVADTFNNTIRRVDLVSSAVTTLAGAAGAFGATDGPGGAARFDTPLGITAASGSLFVADAGNDTIRKIDIASGFVTTVAGWPGEPGSQDGICDLARFNGPEGIVADGSGNLFVSDSFNHTIRKIEIATETVTTLAGTAGQAGTAGGIGAAARFNFPTGIAFDGADTLFVADSVNQLIRMISISTGNVVTVWGATSSTCLQAEDPGRLCFPRGVAVDEGTLYVANTGVDDIRAATITAGDVVSFRTVAGLPLLRGSEGPRFDNPILIASDGADSLYVADANNAEIRRVSLSFDGSVTVRDVTTLAGSPSVDGFLRCDDGIGADAGFARPNGVAVDGGAVYVADTLSRTIRQIVIATGEVTTIAGTCFVSGFQNAVGPDARFAAPIGIVADGRGLLYVADFTAIRAVDVASHVVSTLAGSSQPGSADGIGGAARFNSLGGLAIDAIGNLYVADTGNHTIRKISTTTAAVTTLAGSPGIAGSVDGVGAGARFNAPFGLAFDGDGGLFVSESNTIRRIVLATGAVSTVLGQPSVFRGVKLGAPPARLNQPTGLALIAPGQLAIADRAENVLLTFP